MHEITKKFSASEVEQLWLINALCQSNVHLLIWRSLWPE
jgi:hypothetical protein